MSKFKVGDEVVCIDDRGNNSLIDGSIYKVYKDYILSPGYVYIDIDGTPDFFSEERFELVGNKIITDSALDVQIGGTHYKDLVIQPIEFTHKNQLNFCQGNVVKYITRYKNKNGKADLEKAKHYIDLLIELEYGGK